MKHTMHVGDQYGYWLSNESYLRARASDILFIGFKERLTSNFETLAKALQLSPNAKLPTDDVRAHRSPNGLDKSLEIPAIENLERTRLPLNRRVQKHLGRE